MEVRKTPQKGRKKRKKAWPIESMVSIVGLSNPAFALLGYDELIRLCDGAAFVDEYNALMILSKTKMI